MGSYLWVVTTIRTHAVTLASKKNSMKAMLGQSEPGLWYTGEEIVVFAIL